MLCILFGSFNLFHATKLEAFADDLIKAWQLKSPTILVNGDLPHMCMTHQWLLCLTNNQDPNDLAYQLALNYKNQKQDGIIIIGTQGHKKIIRLLFEAVAPLTSNYPVFMPIGYQNEIKLRLDSNIIFYEDYDERNYHLFDIFAVKSGLPIKLVVGKWNSDNGMTLKMSTNRWDRRTNLQQTTFVNCLYNIPPQAEIIEDKNGNIIGSKGFYQDWLFYITDKLNMTIETIESKSYRMELQDNGSWSGEIGFIQRQEADVVSSGLGINLQRSKFIDYPIAVNRFKIPLVAVVPKGTSPNMWVYVRVFGINQWLIIIMLLVFIAMGLTVIHALSDDQSGRKFGTKRNSSKIYELNSASSVLSLVCLYTIQMGSHTNSKKLSPRLLTLTLSTLTLLAFIFYTGDITAEMTSGPADIPIRTFEDVMYHNYKVITPSQYYTNILASSKPGSSKHEVFSTHFEMKKDRDEVLNAMIQETNSKKLYYGSQTWLMEQIPTETHKAFELEMDDGVYSIGGFGLQKDSEFLHIFNHYLLKQLESGVYRRIMHYAFIYVDTKETFEMDEPQPLGLNNVMFCFISLGLGILLSLITVMIERIKKKISEEQIIVTMYERRGRAKMVAVEGEDDIDRMFDILLGCGVERMEEMQERISLWLETRRAIQDEDNDGIEIL